MTPLYLSITLEFIHATALPIQYYRSRITEYFYVNYPISKKVSHIIKGKERRQDGWVETDVVAAVTLANNY